ncbi:MAG: glycosyltransferase [Candidatus Wallbacteria bacterium]|nr:glycosyltransferase [Candidatus Wallbacteria bacterium]
MKIKPILLNTNDFSGGAARAVQRLHAGLQKVGIDSTLLVQKKSSAVSNTYGPRPGIERFISILRPYIDILPLAFYPSSLKYVWDIGWLPSLQFKRIKSFRPNIVNLHWITRGFIAINDLTRFKLPIVWTLHDSWPFTGGCHVPGECTNYRESCGHCFQLNSKKGSDLSRLIWEHKNRAWNNLKISVVTPSRWLANCAKESSLFRNRQIEVIANSLDLEVFYPEDRLLSRSKLKLPADKTILLFGAVKSLTDKNKGFDIFIKVINRLVHSELKDSFEVAIFGSKPNRTINEIKVPVHDFGLISSDETLRILYSAADVMCIPSRQESFGQTATESMACGTPVACFGGTGLLDIVDHQQSGYLADPYSDDSFCTGIKWLLRAERKKIAFNAIEKVRKEFEVKVIANKYRGLYEKILLSSKIRPE